MTKSCEDHQKVEFDHFDHDHFDHNKNQAHPLWSEPD